MHMKFWMEHLQEWNHLQYQGIGEKIVLKWTLKEQDARVWLNRSALVWAQTAGSCEHSNESLSSIKSGKFIKYLEDLGAYYGLIHVLIIMYSWLTLPGEDSLTFFWYKVEETEVSLDMKR
jgi:hypothetical protein